eukprot:scaffold29738_cov129-Isochrysis_galbana.AAC.3
MAGAVRGCGPRLGTASSVSPADVAANDDVAAKHSIRGHLRIDQVRHDGCGHGELDRRGVDHADHVARAGCFEEAEEGAVEAVLSVELDDLLVVVGALEQLDAGVERPAIRLDEHLHAGPALDCHEGGQAVGGRLIQIFGDDVCGKRELELADVADGHCVGAAGCFQDCGEGAELAVLHIDAHLDGCIVGPVPELNVGVERSALGAELQLHLLDQRRLVGPCA